MLERTKIRNDTVQRLLGNTIVGQRVFPSRTIPLKQTDLPAIIVFTGTQKDSSISIGVPAFGRVLQLVVEGVVTATDDVLLDAAADDLDEQIRNTLLTDAAWVQQFERVQEVETNPISDSDADSRRRSVQLVFSLQLKSEIYEPVIPDDLLSVKIQTDLIDPATVPGPDGNVENEIIVPVPPPV